ncbi:MAG TPA: type VI secretion system protein TssA [Terriglobia bacterium]|nr:type VI secretion system protein TssA [Terriglobia bacterium]
MPLNEALLQPIPGSNPSGESLRYSPIYEKIKEARREEDSAPAGVWEHEVKKADFPLVIKLAQEALAGQTKDLQLAAWLAEALLKKQGFAGLKDGLALCQGLVEKFWDTLHPPVEDGDLELRAAPLEWMGARLDLAVKTTPLNKEGHNFLQYQESRKVGYEDQAKSAEQKKSREAQLKENKLAPEAFDKAFTETPKAFYLQAEKDLDACLAGAGTLEKLCDEKFGSSSAPSFRTLRTALEEVRHLVHALLEKKRETEPDPVEVAPAGEAAAATAEGGVAPGGAGAAPTASILFSVANSSEPEDRREAVASVARAAAFLRQREPLSPAPYLMLRGLRWGELRAAVGASDPTKLEAPPTELRQHIKRLALDQNWKQLLEVAENAMALPSSRAWLDLQRFVLEACVGLGADYEPIARAIRSELKTLLRDLPDLAGATLMDDTPAANSQTQAWLRQLLAEPAAPAADGTTPPQAAATPPVAPDDRAAPGWQRKFVDSFVLAKEALRAGQPDKALEIMQHEIARQPSGRGRFLRKLQLVELCASAGKEAIAQPMLDDLATAVDTYKLEDWEDHELVAQALATIMKLSKRVQGDAKVKQQMFERICRLSPVQALTSG